LLAVVVLASCASHDGPAAPFDAVPSADVTPAPRVYVLNAQIRGIVDPEIEPSAAYGHVQFKLTDNGDATFAVEWKGRIFNPAGEAFVSGVVGIIYPDILPPPGGEVPLPSPPFLTLFRFAASDAVSCGVVDVDSDGIINPDVVPAAIAESWIINPEIHEIRLASVERPDGSIAGTFGFHDPAAVLAWNPQPDPPRERARCAV
jgi:hypothetical protein